MTRRILAQHTGDSTHFGTIDGLDYINKLLTGDDQSSSDPVDINTNMTFYDQKLKIANPANTQVYTFATTAMSGSDKTLTVPATGTNNDEFVSIAHPATLYGKTINVPSGSGGTIRSVVGPDLSLYPSSYVRTGGNIGGSNTAGWGFCLSLLTGNGTPTYNLSATDGRYTRIATSTSANSGAGTRGQNGTGVIRALSARFFCRFRTSDASNCRVYIGLQSDNGAFPSGDDPYNAKSAFAFGAKGADTNWQILRNDGTAAQATQFTDTGVARNTTINTIELIGDEANSRWGYNLNNAGFSYISTSIPASTTALYPIVEIQNATAGAARNLDQWHWFVQITEPTIG